MPTQIETERYKRYEDAIQNFRLMDDDFMRAAFAANHKAVEVTLQVILEKPDLQVVSVRTQEERHNLRGHSVRLDVYAVDSDGHHYDIEIERGDSGVSFVRARYYMSLMDAGNLERSEDYGKLPETFVIFIMEQDIFKRGLPLYHIDRIVRELGELFEDKGHIIFVNGAYHGSDAVGQLMSDFRAKSAKEMNYPALAEVVGYFKDTEQGVNQMCRMMEELRAEGHAEGRAEGRAEGIEIGALETIRKVVLSMFKRGASPEDIALDVEKPVSDILGILKAAGQIS